MKFRFSLIFLCVVVGSTLTADEPIAVYLTWTKQPESTMSIQWITKTSRKSNQILYRMKGSNEAWQTGIGNHQPLPEGHNDHLIHRTELTALYPNCSYEFTIPGFNKTHFFRTMPAKIEAPIRFVVGGDVYHGPSFRFRETCCQARKSEPYFAVLGGDIAYATPVRKDRKENWERWLRFLTYWQQEMVTPEGYLVPILPTTSNEDTKGRFGQTPKEAPFFFALFPTPGIPGYTAIDFGDYLSLFLLDSGHVGSIPGKQTNWLRESLRNRTHVPHTIAAYHCPAWPAHRNPNSEVFPQLRKYFVPLFEEFNLSVAFEHHDHTYKRTHRIRNNQIDPTGILYLGDGGFGANPRRPKSPSERWYLAFTAAERHFYEVTLTNEDRVYRAINHLGEVFDEVVDSVKEPLVK